MTIYYTVPAGGPHTCWPRATYNLTGYLHAVFATAYMPIQFIYKVLLPIKYLYSSHIPATVKI